MWRLVMSVVLPLTFAGIALCSSTFMATETADDGTTFSLQCAKNFKFASAHYMPWTATQDECGQLESPCQCKDVSSTVLGLCKSGKCSFEVTSAAMGGDPCPSLSKYLAVSYFCG